MLIYEAKETDAGGVLTVSVKLFKVKSAARDFIRDKLARQEGAQIVRDLPGDLLAYDKNGNRYTVEAVRVF